MAAFCTSPNVSISPSITPQRTQISPLNETSGQASMELGGAQLEAQSVDAGEAQFKAKDTVLEKESHNGPPSKPTERALLDKPLEELTKEDIMQLTREDCRRYLKEKGMRRPSWNKSQAIQQVLSLKRLFDCKADEGTARVRPTNSFRKPDIESSANLGPTNLHQMCSEEATDTQEEPLAPSQYNSMVIANVQPKDMYSSRVHGDLHLQSLSQFGSVEFSRGSPASMPIPVQPQTGSAMLFQSTCSQNTEAVGVVGRKSSAQLTIFYSGMVNVYDDIPEDKARAIMLLAAKFNQPLSSIRSEFLDSPVSPTADASTTVVRPFGVYSPPVHTSSSGVVSLQQASNSTHQELPPSRKACLQRFLEKRRDRYKSKAPYMNSKKVTSTDLPAQPTTDRGFYQDLVCLAQGQMPVLSGGSDLSSPQIPVQMSSYGFDTCPGQYSSAKIKEGNGGVDRHWSSESSTS